MRIIILIALLLAFIPAAVQAGDCGGCNKCKVDTCDSGCKDKCKSDCKPKCESKCDKCSPCKPKCKQDNCSKCKPKCESKCESKCNKCEPCKPKCKQNTCTKSCKPKCESKCDKCSPCKPKCESKCDKCSPCKPKCESKCNKCEPCNKCKQNTCTKPKCGSCEEPKPNCACMDWLQYSGCEMLTGLCITITTADCDGGTVNPLLLTLRDEKMKTIVDVELAGPIDGYYTYNYTFAEPIKADLVKEAVLINAGDDPATLTSLNVTGLFDCGSFTFIDHTCPGAVIGKDGCPRMVLF